MSPEADGNRVRNPGGVIQYPQMEGPPLRGPRLGDAGDQ